MKRIAAILAGLLVLGEVIAHPELVLLLFPIALLVIGWALGEALLGAWRLTRYGGRLAKAAGRHRELCSCSTCTWRRRFAQIQRETPPPPPWWGR